MKKRIKNTGHPDKKITLLWSIRVHESPSISQTNHAPMLTKWETRWINTANTGLLVQTDLLTLQTSNHRLNHCKPRTTSLEPADRKLQLWLNGVCQVSMWVVFFSSLHITSRKSWRKVTEEYSHTAFNKFSVIPDYPDNWISNFMSPNGGYYIGNVSPAGKIFRWFCLGNCIAIFTEVCYNFLNFQSLVNVILLFEKINDYITWIIHCSNLNNRIINVFK